MDELIYVKGLEQCLAWGYAELRHPTAGGRHCGLDRLRESPAWNFPVYGDGEGGRCSVSGTSSESWILQWERRVRK